MHERTALDRAARTWAVAAAALLGGCAGSPAPDFGPAITLAAADASNPTTAVDRRSGTVYVAWVGRDDAGTNVYLARAERDGTFSSPVRVNDTPGDAAPHEQAPAQVAVGPEGNVYVVWQNNTPVEGRRFPASDLRFARSTDGGRTFEPASTVNDDAGGIPSSHTFHDVTVAGDGTVYVSWIDSRTRDRLEADPRHAPPDSDHGEPPGPDIRVARSTDAGRSFATSVVVDTESCPCCRTSIAAGPDGALYVAWRKVFDGNVRDIVVARSSDHGATFASPVRVHRDGWVFDACPHAGPSLAIDDTGHVHIAWFTGRDGRSGLFYAVSDDDGRTFTDPQRLTPRDLVPPSQARLASDAGTVWIAWEDRAPGQLTIHLARDSGTGAPHAFADTPVPGHAPSLAMAGGTRAVAWLDEDAVRVRVGREGH